MICNTILTRLLQQTFIRPGKAIIHEIICGTPVETRAPTTALQGKCPHPELNWDQRFRKPLLYPFELWGQAISKPKRDLKMEPMAGIAQRRSQKPLEINGL